MTFKLFSLHHVLCVFAIVAIGFSFIGFTGCGDDDDDDNINNNNNTNGNDNGLNPTNGGNLGGLTNEGSLTAKIDGKDFKSDSTSGRLHNFA